MGVNERIKPSQTGVAVTAVTGAAPQTVTAIKVVMNGVETGTLSANVYAKATTLDLTLTAKWQVSDDGTTWIDCAGAPNNPANVAIVTGTGVAVTSTVNIPAPNGVYGKRYSRVVITSGVGVGAGLGTDEASVSYNWRLPSGF